MKGTFTTAWLAADDPVGHDISDTEGGAWWAAYLTISGSDLKLGLHSVHLASDQMAAKLREISKHAEALAAEIEARVGRNATGDANDGTEGSR